MHFVWNGWQYYFLAYIANMALWRSRPLLIDPFTIDHFWSLQVEEQFYLIWPFLIFRIRRLRTLITVSLAACFTSLLFRITLVYLRPHIQNIHVVHSTTPACADNLLFGCCLCALLRTSARQQILKLAPRIFAIGAAILICTGFIYHGLRWQDNFFVPTFGFTIIGITFAALLAMALRNGSRTQAIFSNKTMRFFGKYSYGLYVFHYSIDRMLTPHLRLYINDHFHSKALAVLIGAAAVMAITLPIALLSYHFYEAPFLKLKRFFSYNQKAASTV